MKKYKAIIFDLDGTLIDTLEDLKESLNIVLSNHQFENVSREQVKNFVGNGIRKLVTRALPEEFKRNEAFIDKAVYEMLEVYETRLVKNSKPYENIPELLKYCNKNNIPIAVSSNKHDKATKEIIPILFPDIDFVSVNGQILTNPPKPDPTQTLAIANKMGIAPEDILYVGDSITDYQTARNSNMTPILMSYGYGKPQEINNLEDVKLIDNPLEIINYL